MSSIEKKMNYFLPKYKKNLNKFKPPKYFSLLLYNILFFAMKLVHLVVSLNFNI